MKIMNSVLQIVALILGIILGSILIKLQSQNLINYSKHFEITKIFSNDVNKVLNENVKILCWVMTNPHNGNRWKHIKNMWGKKCSKLVFISSKTEYQNDSDIEVIGITISKDTRDTLWGKTKAAFTYLYQNYYNNYDWFMKVDDDTYLIYENLQNLLYKYDSNLPLLLGHRFLTDYAKRGYMSGMGYVLSKEALKQFFNQLMSNHCRKDEGGYEDLETSQCLENNTIQVDVTEKVHKHTFFPFSPQLALDPFVKEDWYHFNQFYKISLGVNCCSDKPVAFHYVSISNMYLMDYLFYKVSPFGVSNKDTDEKLPEKIDMEQLLLGSLDIRFE